MFCLNCTVRWSVTLYRGRFYTRWPKNSSLYRGYRCIGFHCILLKIVFTNFVLNIYQYCLNKANSKAISLDYRENNVFRQTLSRISEPLKKEDTTTLKAFRILINESCTPNPSTVYLDVIYDIKSWIQPFPLLGTMDPLTFFVLTKKGKGEVELVYRLLPGDKQKEWLPIEKPFIIKDAPPGYPTFLKPENAKNVTANVMDRAMNHLTSRLTRADMEWWRWFFAGQREQRIMWEEMAKDEDMEAGKPLISALFVSSLCPQIKMTSCKIVKDKFHLQASCKQ